MKPEIKNSNSNVLIEQLQDIIIAVESLEEYFSNSMHLVQKKRLETEANYELGLLIAEKFSACFKLETAEEFEQYTSTLNNHKLKNGKSISDYINIEYELNEDRLPQSISYTLNASSTIDPKFVDPKIARREYSKIKQYENMLISSTLSNVIILFERYLASVYEVLILINPKKYFENQKIEIANIFNRNVRDIVIDCVKKEVESNMFDSLKTLELISEKENININRYRNILDEFEEIYYRRNLYIHNEGIVNKLYLSNVKEKFKKNLSLDSSLCTDEVYLRYAIDMLYKIICTLFYELQLTHNPKYEKWNLVLSNIAFDLLQKKNYEVAEQIYLIMSSTKSFCFRDKAMFRINYINALKQQEKFELVRKELDALDVSIATEDFKIAKLCLEDKNEEVYNELSAHYPECYSADLIRDWPIFINFRDSEFYTKFVNEHKDDFGVFVYEHEEAVDTQKNCSNNEIESN